MRIDRAVDAYLRHIAVERGLSENTVAAYRRDLSGYAGWLREQGVEETAAVTPVMLGSFVADRAAGHPPMAASSLARLQSQFDPAQVRVVTVTTDLYPQGIKQFLDHLGIDLPVLFDEDQELSRRFMVRGLPTTVLIGQDGQAIGRAVGPRSWDSRESVALVQQILGHQP